jgi:hypothetical protein
MLEAEAETGYRMHHVRDHTTPTTTIATTTNATASKVPNADLRTKGSLKKKNAVLKPEPMAISADVLSEDDSATLCDTITVSDNDDSDFELEPPRRSEENKKPIQRHDFDTTQHMVARKPKPLANARTCSLASLIPKSKTIADNFEFDDDSDNDVITFSSRKKQRRM